MPTDNNGPTSDPVYPKPDPPPVPGLKSLQPLGPSASGDAYEARFRRLEHRMDQLLALLRDRPSPFVEYPKQINSKRMAAKVVVNSKEEEEFHGKEAPLPAGVPRDPVDPLTGLPRA